MRFLQSGAGALFVLEAAAPLACEMLWHGLSNSPLQNKLDGGINF